jgi:carbon starvation protein CstA
MPTRLRSFIGTIVIIIMVIVYAILATSYAAANLAESPWWVHLLYFTGTGLLWVLPAMALIKWMAGRKPGK